MKFTNFSLKKRGKNGLNSEVVKIPYFVCSYLCTNAQAVQLKGCIRKQQQLGSSI